MENASECAQSSPKAPSLHHPTRPPDRPCDMCRKRKTKCVKEDGQTKCVRCAFHRRHCTFIDGPVRRKRRRVDHVDDLSMAEGDEDGSHQKPERRTTARDDRVTTGKHEPGGTSGPGGTGGTGSSLLDRALGLNRTAHSKYVGSSGVHDEQLIGVLPYADVMTCAGDDSDEANMFLRVNETTSFVRRSDAHALFADDEVDIEAIEQVVRPYGPALIDLYYRICHPNYPVLHKAVWIETYQRSFHDSSPPVLAAMYALATDWWDYDRDLFRRGKPEAEKLVKLAIRSLTSTMHCPKLSTVQAGLLLLQPSGGDSWVLTSQIVAVAEELGLHLDCSNWSIPAWEKGVRRKLQWAVYMQEKWAALLHGRPSHIVACNWQMRRLSAHDFSDSAADDDGKEGSSVVESGRSLFMHLADLTDIMEEALRVLYAFDQTHNKQILASQGIPGLLELIKPTSMRLEDWAAHMPPELRLSEVKTRKLCSNGYLHLAYLTTEIIIHRFIIRSITSDTPFEIRQLCRKAAKARLEHAATFIEALRPEHLQSFWFFASVKCLAVIRSFGALLWATSTTEAEAQLYRRTTENFTWSLKVRAKGVAFLSAAIRDMDEAVDEFSMLRPVFGPPSLNAPYRVAESPHQPTGRQPAKSTCNVDSTDLATISNDPSETNVLDAEDVASDALYAGLAGLSTSFT